MRITNKIMNNNSLYNINNNKVAEDEVNTQMATGKKIARPSDDPVIAIRALRLRSTVSQLDQYYQKNAKDAKSWMDVTEDALSTVTDVLTDAMMQANRGANKDLTMTDINTIVTQLDALSSEYYSTGNVDYAGRYIFTGFRTDTSLSYEKTTTENFTDINDEFNAADISRSKRAVNSQYLDAGNLLDNPVYDASGNITGYKYETKENDIEQIDVGRIRLSYDNLDYTERDAKSVELKYRENLFQEATSSITDTNLKYFDLTFVNGDGVEQNAYVPLSDSYTITVGNYQYNAEVASTKNPDKGYIITALDLTTYEVYQFDISKDGVLTDGDGDGEFDIPTGLKSGMVSMHETSVSTIDFSDGTNTHVTMPLLGPVGQQYKVDIVDKYGGVTTDYSATVNGDGTFTIEKETDDNEYGNPTKTVLQIATNGSVHSSYRETTIKIDPDHILYSTSTDDEIDDAYRDLTYIEEEPKREDYNTGDDSVDQANYENALQQYIASREEFNKERANKVYLNAKTGEVLLNDILADKLASLAFVGNANTIDVVYDKKEWQNGDIRPQNLFSCVDSEGIIYNGGSASHDIQYDVGYSQKITVNTTATSVFTTTVKRDVYDLQQIANKMNVINTTMDTLKDKLSGLTDALEIRTVQNEIDACKKAYDYLRQNMQEEFEHKITSIQAALDKANVAVTDNGARSKRLELINSRLQDQNTTFKTLQSDNEDADLAETATNLATAQLTYQAALMATGKISKDTLMNYI
ncbi:flagellin N-terminal helical domain-containing protein [Butyrivibrio sp. AE3004]|uniref:flagellin N-terminal helical domain-containing protein n=1 Tax=Butyrivibrio sp. AE3004 TaxID=1506994 RepID=UPI0006903E5F|nr:flagellin [Butyrivibrio sp. AE3004]